MCKAMYIVVNITLGFFIYSQSIAYFYKQILTNTYALGSTHSCKPLKEWKKTEA